jgi:hypothetical protein
VLHIQALALLAFMFFLALEILHPQVMLEFLALILELYLAGFISLPRQYSL